jgi:serine protease Do
LNDQAVRVVEVLPGGAAQAAGLSPGDLIVTAAGRGVASTDDLHRVLSTIPADRPVPLEIVRDERRLELSVLPKWDG